VLYPERFHASRSLKKRARSGLYHITCNQAFADVVYACATVDDRQHGTWITQAMFDAYSTMHQLGWAHSVEVWRNQTLVGGVYGLALGNVFFGESMFSHETDTSKLALMALCRTLIQLGFPLLDCQVENAHLLSLGAECIPRERFQTTLQQHAHATALPSHTLRDALLLATRFMTQEAS
jgi:leucyl/phenylalanyl-tRNA--protein transferase